MAKLSKRLLGVFVAVCMLASLFTCMIGINVSAESADMLSFDGTNAYGVVAYTTSWADIPAGDYRFEMDCKITSGTPVCYPCGRIWNSEESTTKFSNRNYTYDEENYKYIVTFTITSDISGNFSMYIGNYDGALGGSGDAVFACANPKLYSIDDLGNATEATSIIKYDFNTYTDTKDVSSSTTHKWRRLSSKGVTRSEIPDGYFDQVVPEYVHFEPNRNDYSRFIYLLGYGALDAGDYRFQMDCKIFSGTPRICVGNRESNTYPKFDTQTNYTATYDAENYKYTITFTLTADLTGDECMGILIGNYGDDGDFVCANPTFYELDGSGDPTGDNLINTFATQFYNSSLATGKWYRAGHYTCTVLPEHYFDLESTNTYIARFPAGRSNYQMLAYKDTGIYTTAGTYRLIADVSVTGDDEPSVMMRTGTDIGNTVTSNGVVSTVGNTRVYEFTVDTAARGIGVMLGNYGVSDTLDVTFGKIGLYKYADGVYQGANILAPFNADTYDRGDWSYKRDTANNARWTPINCDGEIIKVGEYGDAVFCAHDGETETVEAVASTCCTQGHGEYVICKICGATVSGDDTPLDLDPTNHEGETEVRNAKDATCTEAGYTGDTYCLGCGEKIADGEDIEALGHSGGTATCHSKAVCGTCGEEYGEFDPNNHDGETEVRDAKDATCTEAGYTGDTYCLGCGAKIADGEDIDTIAHTVGEWIFDQVSHHRHCDMCDEDVDVGEHAYQWVVVTPATMEADGLKKEVCSICGYESGNTDVIPKLENHTPGDINGDGAVNNKDLTRLFQYLSDWDVQVTEAALDVNGDGNVNNKDLTRLFQYLSDWDVEIH